LHWWTCGGRAVGDLSPVETDQIIYHPVPRRLRPGYKLPGLKAWITRYFWVPRAAAELRRMAEVVRPEVVWCQLTGWAIPVFWQAGLLHSHRCHASLWDYHSSRNHCRTFGFRQAHRLTSVSEAIMRRSATCDVISESMREDLGARLGRRDAVLVHSGFEPAQLEELARMEMEPPSEIRVAYAGSIIAPDAFRLFVQAMERVRRTLPRPLTLELFSQSFRNEPWFDGAWMREYGLLDEECFFRELRRCSWGLSAMHLTDEDPSYNRYSFPNKFGTYLSAGLPLIVLAHRESSAARMIRSYPAGVHTDLTDPQALADFLRPVLHEENPRRRFHTEILRCARTEFDGERMRHQVWHCLGVR